MPGNIIADSTHVLTLCKWILVKQMELTTSIFQLYHICCRTAKSLDVDRAVTTAYFITNRAYITCCNQIALLVDRPDFMYLYASNVILIQRAKVDSATQKA